MDSEANQAERDWYPLDNAATLFPSVVSPRITTLFRVSATLAAPVRAELLQRALANISPRFPYYMVHLKAGVFWYHLVKRSETPAVCADQRSPCMAYTRKMRGAYLFRVRAFGPRIAVEFSHILTDGTGALTFLRALLLEYFALSGVTFAEPAELVCRDQPPDPAESEDAYRRFFVEGIPDPDRHPRAFQLPYHLLPPGTYNVITGILPVEPLTALARARGVTVTVLLAAVLIHAIQEVYFELPARARRGGKFVRLMIPVNLRRIFPSKTMRNFSLFVIPGIDLRLGRYELDEILSIVHHYLKVAITGKYINQQIARNIRGERHPLVRVIPLFLKNIVLPQIYYLLGEALITSVITNLGPVEMPVPLDELIERFEFIPAPSALNRTNCGVITYRDRMYVSFGRMVRESDVERRFFSTLVRLKIPVKIETN